MSGWAVTQDLRGTLWVGTSYGMFRDNGLAMKIYSTFSGLTNNDVTWIHAGRNEVYVLSRSARTLIVR